MRTTQNLSSSLVHGEIKKIIPLHLRLRARVFLLAAVLLPFLFSPGGRAVAGSATWNLNPLSGDWNTTANWTPATVPNGPNDIATFVVSNTTAISFSGGDEVSEMVFDPGASAFTFTVQSQGFQGLTVSGAGITNNSAVTQNFVLNNALEAIPMLFLGNASAGTATNFTVNDNVGTVGLEFQDLSSAGSATITVSGGPPGGAGAVAFFLSSATAANATFTNKGGVFTNAGGGLTEFYDTSTADNATIISEGGTASGAYGGTTYFAANASAAHATLIATSGRNGGSGGLIRFFSEATGDDARIKVLGNGMLDLSFVTPSQLGVGSLEGDGQVLLSNKTLFVGANNLNTNFSGTISGDGSLAKVGRGTLALTGGNTYTGGTTIEDGQLLVDTPTGSGLGSGSVQVNAGRLGGNGTIAGSVTIGTGTGGGATLAPGERCDELGTIAIQGTVTFNSDAKYNCELKTRQHTIVDTIVANGVTINGGQFVIAARGSRALPRGTALTVINNTAATPIAGSFDNLADGSIFTIGNNTYQVSYEGNDGNDLTLTVQ